MSTPIIVMGANGRMGRTICTLVQEDPAFTLAGVVERSEFAAGLAALSCPVSQNVEELLQSLDGKAVVVDFTAPEVSLATARSVAKFGAAHVIGTTGFTNEQKQELAKLAESCRMFWAPNEHRRQCAAQGPARTDPRPRGKVRYRDGGAAP